MRPKKPQTTGEGDLFRARLDQIINMKHELVQLAGAIDWEWLDAEIAPVFSDKGRPASPTRFMIGLLLLKHIFTLSDEQVCERWVYDPYFRTSPARSSSSSVPARALRFEPLAQQARRQAGAAAGRDLADRACHRRVAHQGLGAGHGRYHRAAQGHHLSNRRQAVACRHQGAQSVGQKAWRAAAAIVSAHRQRAAMMAGRYAHAKQFKRHQRQLRFLRARLGRLIRDIGRKIAGHLQLEAVFQWPLTRARQIRSQQQRQRGWKLYSFHAPEVECIGKGKASAPYEFGVNAQHWKLSSRDCTLAPEARDTLVLPVPAPYASLWPGANGRPSARRALLFGPR